MEYSFVIRRFARAKHILLPLSLVSIAAPGIEFLGPDVWLVGRWIVLAAMGIYGIVYSKSAWSAQTMVLIAYVVWCMLSYSWSVVPILTMSKLGGLVFVVTGCYLGSYLWVTEHEQHRWLTFLWPYAIVAALSWIISPENTEQVDGYVRQAGATGNPNFLGLIVATSTPIVIVSLQRDWSIFLKRVVWLALLAIYIVALYYSGSRASFLVCIGIVGGFLAAQDSPWKVTSLLIVLLSTVVIWAVEPDILDSVMLRLVYRDSVSESVFETRQGPWATSYEAAIAGGDFGFGYGVTYGEDEYEPGFTANTYGREKGNSQLAIIEETGVIGFVFYLCLIISFLWKLVKGFCASPHGECKLMIGLMIGCFIGLIGHSVFEGWWVAPGSVEFGMFWAFAGAGCAMADTAIDATVDEVSISNQNEFKECAA